MALIDRVRKRAKELDQKLITGLPNGGYYTDLLEDRQLLEDCEKALAASRIDHPIPGQEN